jgi:hypothetical protein
MLLLIVTSCEHYFHQKISFKVDNNDNIHLYLSIYLLQTRPRYVTIACTIFNVVYFHVLFQKKFFYCVLFCYPSTRVYTKPWMCGTARQSRVFLSRVSLNHPYQAYARYLSVSLANIRVHFCSTTVVNETRGTRET